MNQQLVYTDGTNVASTENSRFPRPDMTRAFVDEAMKMFKKVQEQQKTNFEKEFDKLKVGQARTREFNKLIKLINQQTNADGTLNIQPGSELHQLLLAASQEIPATTLPVNGNAPQDPPLSGIEVDASKTTYTKEELHRLLENIRISVDDMNVVNELQLQTVNRLVAQQQELFQIMKSLLKPLHDTKIGMARAIAGR